MLRVKIEYQPIQTKSLLDSGRQETRLTLSEQTFYGMLLMLTQLGINRFQYALEDSPKTSFDQYLIGIGQHTPYDLSSFLNPYTPVNNIVNLLAQPHNIMEIDHPSVTPADISKVGTAVLVNDKQSEYGLLVQFDSYEFIQGAIYACNLFGEDWTQYIQHIRMNGQPTTINTDTYLGKISVPGLTSLINLSRLDRLLGSSQTKMLSRRLRECFGGFDFGVFIPTDIYIMATDFMHQNLTSTIYVTPNLFILPQKYHSVDGLYIYNVCTDPRYRGRGFAKSTLIAAINDNLGKTFYLEVDPDNTPAYRLYSGLGFEKVDETRDRGKLYHLMRLTL